VLRWRAAIAICAFTPSKADIVYNVNLTVGIGSAIGTITTDGTVGTSLSTVDITGWNLALNDGLTTTALQGPATNQSVQIRGTIFTATATGLFFDFSSTQSPGDVLFDNANGSGAFLCFTDAAAACASFQNTSAITIGIGLSDPRQNSVQTGNVQIGTAQRRSPAPSPVLAFPA